MITSKCDFWDFVPNFCCACMGSVHILPLGTKMHTYAGFLLPSTLGTDKENDKNVPFRWESEGNSLDTNKQIQKKLLRDGHVFEAFLLKCFSPSPVIYCKSFKPVLQARQISKERFMCTGWHKSPGLTLLGALPTHDFPDNIFGHSKGVPCLCV